MFLLAACAVAVLLAVPMFLVQYAIFNLGWTVVAWLWRHFRQGA